MSIKPKVSVVLPIFNSEAFVEESIESILCQSFENFELIVVNDGSTDRSKEIILSKKDERIIYLENVNNQGLTKSLNKGLYYSKGEFILRMDADDFSLPNRIRTQLEYMNSDPNLDILSSNIIFKSSGKRSYFISTNRAHQIHLLQFNTIAHPTVMIRKTAIRERNLYYDKNFNYAEDYKLWVDAVINGLTIETIEEPLFIYNDCNENSITKSKQQEMIQNADCIRFLYARFCFGEYLWNNLKPYFRFLNGILSPVKKENLEVMDLANNLLSLNQKNRFLDKLLFEEMVNSLVAPFKNIS